MKRITETKSYNLPEYCIIALPGQGGSGPEMASKYADYAPEKCIVIGLTPENQEWYPLPKGPNNQAAAVKGIKSATEGILWEIEKITSTFEMPLNKVAVVGFSAGGVMSLQTIMHEPKLACAVCHSGAILDINSVPTGKSKIFLTHHKEDNVFTYKERFVPMRGILEAKGYDITIENKNSSIPHSLDDIDILNSLVFISGVFKWSKDYVSKLHTFKNFKLRPLE